MTTLTIHLEIGHNASIRDKTTSEGFTHDWDVFVRGANGADIRHYVDRVVFHLHETFEKPKRVAKEPPYSVSTSGYAGFNLPIQIYLKNNQEPRKIHFNYDLQLQPSGPPIHKVQKEKYTFHGVSEDFRSRLLKGGAILGSSGANLENSSAPLGKIEEKSQMTSKPRFSGASEQPKKYKTKLDEPKSDQFTNLFGTPITKTSRTAEVPKSKEVSKPLAKSSTSNSTNNSGKGDKLSLDKDKTKKSPYKDKDRDKEKPKDNKDRQPTENNSKKDEKKDKRDKKEYGRKDKKERDKDKSPQLRPKSASPKRAKSPSPKSNSNKEREKDREKDKKSKKHSKDKEMKHREKESSKDKDKDYKTKDNKNSKEKENSGNSVSNNISVKEAEKTEKSKEKAKEEPKEKIDNEKTKHKHKKKDKEHKKEKKERDDKVHKREEKKQESYNNKNSSSQKSVSTKERDKTDNLFGTSPKSEPSASPPPRADLEPEKPIPMLIDDSSNTSKLSSRESSPSSPPRVRLFKKTNSFLPKDI
ncbi:hypothetical protein ABEB36_013002 [Hypothenemus hampei]|uniref:YEATS domain-containing protein n=1 Tax=Hypothenemus hampei TaxID=57062 RepID=A0ABD1E6H1_HYPHA